MGGTPAPGSRATTGASKKWSAAVRIPPRASSRSRPSLRAPSNALRSGRPGKREKEAIGSAAIIAHVGGASMRPDIAATDALADSLARLLPALESFTRFEGADPAARRTLWRAALDEPLPEAGAGREAVLETLRSYVIANGLRIGAPGFSGWVTTMPTDRKSTRLNSSHLGSSY